jgi:multidrug resistance protein, MATE family
MFIHQKMHRPTPFPRMGEGSGIGADTAGNSGFPLTPSGRRAGDRGFPLPRVGEGWGGGCDGRVLRWNHLKNQKSLLLCSSIHFKIKFAVLYSTLLNKRILLLAIPNIITNIAIPLLGMVDLGLMGHLESMVYVGAVAIGGTVFNFIFWGFGFLRMGTSGFTAQSYGSRDLKESLMVLIRSVTIGLAAGFLLILLQKPVALLAFSLIRGSSSVNALAEQYYAIRIWSAPATLTMYALTGWFIGMQNAKIPMTLSIFVNLMNILFSLGSIYLLKMKSDGIALANVLSQCSGIVLGIFFLRGYFKKLKKFLDLKAAFHRKDLVKFLNVNKDILIRTLCLIFTLSFFTAKSAGQSDTMLAVNTLLFQFFYFFSYFIDGFAYAAEALTGKYIGARDPGSLRKVIKLLFIWGVALAVIFIFIYGFGGRFILGLLTNNTAILDAAGPYLFWIALIPLITFSAFIWDGIYIGATASVAMRNAMVIITFLVFLPAYYLLRGPLGNHGLWLAIMLFMLSRGIILTLFSRRAIFVNR